MSSVAAPPDRRRVRTLILTALRALPHRGAPTRRVTALLSVLWLVVANPSPAHAEPIDATVAPNPYPTDSLVLAAYHRVDPTDYFIPGLYGVYFLTPGGLNCGIWLRGSFGCAGPLPGGPPGADHIGWFNGDTRVHYDPFIWIGFPNAHAHRVLPPRSYVIWNETTCATLGDTSIYCYRGMFRFLISPDRTYLNG